MFAKVLPLLLIFVHTEPVFSFDSTNVVFTIVSPNEPYLASVANRLIENIQDQILSLENRTATVHATHQEFPVPGAWTIVPLLRPLVTRYGDSDVRWVVFLEPHTAVRCQKLLEALAAADDQEAKWIGYPLSDYEPTIIHHFSFYDELEEDGGLVYPNFASGFAMNMHLMKTFLAQIEKGGRRLEADFSIDPAFELAQLVYGNAKEPGPLMTTDLSFCILSGDNCATYPRQFELCGSAILERSVLFAVKTWSGNHQTRLRIVKKTWGSLATHIRFYSDLADPVQKTIDIGVPNSKTGHCVKTIAILKDAVRYAKLNSEIKWIFLADDDTILGVQRLLEVLSCYAGGESFTVLGERYGYGYLKKQTKGYDYITGGGGTAFSVSAAAILSQCACAGVSAPDDMTLGACARRNNYSIVHSPLFHQARPQDYPREVLSRDRPVSFHRHSSPDPVKVYVTWFQHDDLMVKKSKDEL